MISLAPAPAAPLLGEAEKIKVAARLLQAEADLAGRRGDGESAHSLRSRALELYLEALAVAEQVEEDDCATLRLWSAEVEHAALADRYQRRHAQFLAE